jgi:hypothetical protein
MANAVVSVFVVVFLLQFLRWVLLWWDVRGTDDTTLRWFVTIAIFPLIGLVVTLWYVTKRDAVRQKYGSVGDERDDGYAHQSVCVLGGDGIRVCL